MEINGATILQERWEAALVQYSPKWVMHILGYCTQKEKKEKKKKGKEVQPVGTSYHNLWYWRHLVCLQNALNMIFGYVVIFFFFWVTPIFPSTKYIYNWCVLELSLLPWFWNTTNYLRFEMLHILHIQSFMLMYSHGNETGCWNNLIF